MVFPVLRARTQIFSSFSVGRRHELSPPLSIQPVVQSSYVRPTNRHDCHDRYSTNLSRVGIGGFAGGAQFKLEEMGNLSKSVPFCCSQFGCNYNRAHIPDFSAQFVPPRRILMESDPEGAPSYGAAY